MGNQLPDSDKLEEAALIKAGTYTGSLGEKEEGGQRDNEDYYSISEIYFIPLVLIITR